MVDSVSDYEKIKRIGEGRTQFAMHDIAPVPVPPMNILAPLSGILAQFWFMCTSFLATQRPGYLQVLTGWFIRHATAPAVRLLPSKS